MKIYEKKPVEFDLFDGDKTASLNCPRCNNCGCLHQQRVFAWFRNGEDSNKGTFVMADYHSAESQLDADQGGNPSEWRDGITIEFACEHCTNDAPAFHPCDRVVMYLDIVQHKGHTQMSWRYSI